LGRALDCLFGRMPAIRDWPPDFTQTAFPTDPFWRKADVVWTRLLLIDVRRAP
jgi:hypothetical protein